MADRIIRFFLRYPLIIIIPVLAATAFFGYHAREITFDTDIEALIPSGGVTGEFVAHYEDEHDTFDYLVFAVTAEDLYDPEGLSVLYDTIYRIAAIDIFDSPVTPFNFTTFERIGTRIRPAYPGPDQRAPETEEEIELFRQRLEQDPFARNFVISADQQHLAVYYPQPVKTEAHDHYVSLIREALEPLEAYYDVYVIGSLFYGAQVQQYLFEDLNRLLLLAALFMVVLFYRGFRAFRAVLLPMAVVGIGTVWCAGAMVLLEYPVTVITVALPPIILALGSSYTIHMLNQYMRDSVSSFRDPYDPAWMAAGTANIAGTIFIAGITTLIGFSSLLFSQIDQIMQFGLAAVIGIASCMVLSLFFLPSALALFPHPNPRAGKTVTEGRLTRLMHRTGPHVIRNSRRYAAVSLIMLVLGAALYPRIEQKTDFLDYFPDDDPVIQDTYYIIEHFGSFHHIYLTMTAPQQQENYFLDPQVLQQVYQFEQAVSSIPDVGYAASFPGYIAFMHELMTGEKRIPDSRGLMLMVSRVFKVASVRGIDGVGTFTNDDMSEITYTLRIHDSAGHRFIYDEDLKKRLAEIREYAQQYLPEGVEYSFWGWNLIFADLADILKHDQNTSLMISAAGVAFVSMLFFKSLILGLVSLIPLAAGLFLTYIAMAVLGIPMDMTSAMIASIAIGVGVDDAIHFLIHYRRRRKEQWDVRDAVTDTIVVTGRPIILTSLAIIGGMLILVSASFKPITFFGALVSLALAGACLGTVLVLPSWLLVCSPKQPGHGASDSESSSS